MKVVKFIPPSFLFCELQKYDYGVILWGITSNERHLNETSQWTRRNNIGPDSGRK
jgi:hypothetical protein